MADNKLIAADIDENSGIAWLTLNRPEKKNALSIALLKELADLLRVSLTPRRSAASLPGARAIPTRRDATSTTCAIKTIAIAPTVWAASPRLWISCGACRR